MHDPKLREKQDQLRQKAVQKEFPKLAMKFVSEMTQRPTIVQDMDLDDCEFWLNWLDQYPTRRTH